MRLRRASAQAPTVQSALLRRWRWPSPLEGEAELAFTATSTTAGYSNRTVSPSRRALTPMASPPRKHRSSPAGRRGPRPRGRTWQPGGRAPPASGRNSTAARAAQRRGTAPSAKPADKLHRGGVAVALHPVERCGLGGVVRGHRVVQHDAAAGAAYPHHLGEGRLRRLQGDGTRSGN